MRGWWTQRFAGSAKGFGPLRPIGVRSPDSHLSDAGTSTFTQCRCRGTALRKAGQLALFSLQWLVVSSLVSASILIVMSSVLGMRGAQADSYVARGIAFVGLFSISQMLFGHRSAAYEGPSTFTLAAVALVLIHLPAVDRIPALCVALMFSGAALAVLSFCPVTTSIALRLESAYLNGMFLLLLGLTVAIDTMPKALGHGSDPGAERIVMLVVVVAVTLLAEAVSAFRNLSVLLAVVAGGAAMLAYGGIHVVPAGRLDLITPRVSRAYFSVSAIVPAIGAAVMIAGNSWFTEVAVARAQRSNQKPSLFRRGLLITAISHLVQGLLPGMGTVPHGESGALVAKRPRSARLALGLASSVMILVPFVPGLRRVTAWYPPTLGADVLLAISLSLGLLGLRQLVAVNWQLRRAICSAAAVLACAGVALAPRTWFPGPFGVIGASPIVVGVLLALCGEGGAFRRRLPVMQDRPSSLDDLPIDR